MKKYAPLLPLLLAGSLFAYDNVSLEKTVPFEKQVKEPAGLLSAKSGKVIVSDASQAKLAVFSDGKLEGFWGAKGKEPGQFGEPRGLAEDADGNVYVADAGNHRVQVLGPDGKPLRVIGSKGEGPGQLSAPAAVAVTYDGFVFVADAGNNRVQVFTRDGIYLHSFGSEGTEKGQFKEPADIAVSRTGAVFVLDRGNKRVQKFTAAGKFTAQVGAPGATGKEQEALPAPAALAVDAYGFVYVADGQQNKVKEFSPSGEFSGTFGTWGTGPGQFKEVAGLAVGADGVIVVSDRANRRAQAFRLDSAAKVKRQAAIPTLRLRVKAGPSAAVDVDDFGFVGETLVGVSRKANQLVFAGDHGRGAARVLGGKNKEGLKLDAPGGVAVSGGKIFVADTGNRRVLLLDEKGAPAEPGEIGGSGKREGQFKAPQSAAVDAQGRIYVSDSSLSRCQVFSRDGIFLNTFGSAGAQPGQFAAPGDMASLGDQIAVVDPERRAVLVFDTKGKFLLEIPNLVAPVAVAADPAAPFYYVLDGGQVRVVKDNGQSVASFGAGGLLAAPRSLALDGKGRLWVSDAGSLKGFEVAVLPAAPSDLKAAPGEGQIALSLAPDAEKLAQSYAIYRATSAQAEPELYEVVPATAMPFIDVEIVPGLTYYYSVAGRTSPESGGAEGARASAKASTARPANLPSMDLTALSLENIFSAQYKYYVTHPIGKATVKNNTEKTFQKIRVGFIVQDFMDYPTEILIERLKPGEPWPLELKGVFNNKILSVSEDTPIQAQITVTYYEDGQEKVFKRSHPFTLHSRNAMSWEDPRRIATFVTPKDPPVLEFARGVVKPYDEEIAASPLTPAVVMGQVLFEALGTRGLSYLKDPNNPFQKAQQDTKTVDYVQYPRETLKRKSGDCDDLVNLYASLLESVTVPTALLDLPGHILMMFRADDAGGPLNLPEHVVVEHDGGVWIPVEATLVGKSFEEAWREGARTYRSAAEGDKTIIDVHSAWDVYQPATLPEEPSETPPTKEEVAAKFPDSLARLAELRLNQRVSQCESKLAADPSDAEAHLQMGLAYAEHGKYDQAGEWFDKLIALKPEDAGALNNRGNVWFVKGDAAKAREYYEKAAAADAGDADVRLNLARAALKAGDKPAAEKALQEALSLKPELRKEIKSIEELAP